MEESRRIKLTKQRWGVLLASCVINLCIGALYTWSVFSGPMEALLTQVGGSAVTDADLAIVFFIANGPGFVICGFARSSTRPADA